MMRSQDDTPELDELDRRALLDQMQPAPRSAIGGATADFMSRNKPAASGMAAPPPEAQPVDPAQTGSRSGSFQSDNKSLGGYLQEAAAAYRPELIKLGSDAERKSAAEAYIRSLEPELKSRGWKGGDIKNEKIQVDGRWMDLYRDVDGAAEAQYLDVTDSGPGPGAGGAAMMTSAPSAFQGIQSLMPTDEGFYNTLQAKLQQILGGPGAMDRQALLSQLQR